MQDQLGSRIKVIARPSDADTATCRGAAQYGLARRPLVSSVIAPRSYIMKVRNSITSLHSCETCAVAWSTLNVYNAICLSEFSEKKVNHSSALG